MLTDRERKQQAAMKRLLERKKFEAKKAAVQFKSGNVPTYLNKALNFNFMYVEDAFLAEVRRLDERIREEKANRPHKLIRVEKRAK